MSLFFKYFIWNGIIFKLLILMIIVKGMWSSPHWSSPRNYISFGQQFYWQCWIFQSFIFNSFKTIKWGPQVSNIFAFIAKNSTIVIIIAIFYFYFSRALILVSSTRSELLSQNLSVALKTLKSRVGIILASLTSGIELIIYIFKYVYYFAILLL